MSNHVFFIYNIYLYTYAQLNVRNLNVCIYLMYVNMFIDNYGYRAAAITRVMTYVCSHMR